MISGVWGKKVGMTQVFIGDKAVPVTAIDVSNWIVTDICTQDRDGYDAVQVGCLRNRYAGETFSKDWLKQRKKHFSIVREIKLSQALENVEVGQNADFLDSIIEGGAVDVFGKTRGRGFAGGVKRHGFAGGPASHGSTLGRAPGSMTGARSQGKVPKGKRLPGHMGTEQRMMKNLKVVKVESDAKIILVKGSVPGHAGSLVFVRKVVKAG